MNKLLALAFALLVCGGLISSGLTQEALKGAVSGVVRLRENGHAIDHVRVSLVPTDVPKAYVDEDVIEEHSVRTDATGGFMFRDVPAGQYQIEASARSHTGSPIVVEVDEGKTSNVSFKLDPDDPRLSLSINQQVVNPQDSPAFEISGFVPSPTVGIDVYRMSEADLVAAGSAEKVLDKWRTGDDVEPKNAKPILTLSYSLKNSDAEGDFEDHVKLKQLAEGCYLVRCHSGGVAAQGFFNVSRIGLVTRSDPGRTLCYVANLADGTPVAGVQIFSITNGRPVAAGVTGVNGQLSVPVPPTSGNDDSGSDSEKAYFGRLGASFAITEGGAGGNDTEGKIALVTDRPIYRPGDIVQFKGYVRLLQHSAFTIPSPGEVDITVQDPDNNKVTELTAHSNAHGSFSGEWETGSQLKPGVYQFVIDVAGLNQTFNVMVATYRKPEFSVAVSSDRPRYDFGDHAALKVHCEYYYGAPVVGASVELTVYRNPRWSYYDWDSDSGDVEAEDASGSQASGGELVADLKGTTDGSGDATFEVPLTLVNPNSDNNADPQDYTYSTQAYASDASGKGFQGNGSFDVTQGDFAIEAQPSTWFGSFGSQVPVAIRTISSDAEGQPAPNVALTVKTFKEHVDAKNNTVDDLLSTQAVSTDSQGHASVPITLSKHGNLLIRIAGADTAGHAVQSETYIESYSPGESPDDEEDNGPQLAIKLDKQKYKVGDVVHALVTGAGAARAALVSVDGDAILSSRTIDLSGSTGSLDFPVTEDMAPDAFIDVVTVAGGALQEASARVNLNWRDKNLNIELASDNTKYAPGGEAKIHVRTTDSDHHPVSADVSLGVVDESIYAIQPDSLDLRGDFYPMREDQVRTRYSFEQIYLDGGDKSPSSVPIRQNFKDTAAWAPFVQTGPDGTATVSITLPDNLTTWRVTASGLTDQTAVGQQTLKFRTWKPVMVRLDAPVYLVKGDTQTIVVGVTNATDSDSDFKVSLAADQARIASDPNVTCHIAAGKQEDLTWQIQSTGAEVGTLTAEALGSSVANSDAIKKTFTILPPNAAAVSNANGRIVGDAAVDLKLDPESDPGFGELKLSVTPSVAAGVIQSLDSLIDYPYGCVEQTLDRFVPSLEAVQMAKDLHLKPPSRSNELPEIARDSLDRLAAMQHADGGWGWWEDDPSNATMTGLVLEGLARAKGQGYDSTQIRLDAAYTWAAHEIDPQSGVELHDYDRLFLGLALAHHGRAHDARVSLKFDRNLAGPAEWSLAARIEHGLGDQVSANACLDHLRHSAVTIDGMTRWLGQGWTDQDTNTGLAFEAFTEIDPKDPLLPDVVAYFMQNRQSEAWSSTFATAQILAGLDTYLLATGEAAGAGSLEVELDGKPLTTLALGGGQLGNSGIQLSLPLSKLQVGNNRLTFRHSGTGICYYNATLRQFSGQPGATLPVATAPVTITRQYFLVKPRRTAAGEYALEPGNTALETAQSGDVLECVLTIKSPSPREFVMIEDPTPSNCHVTEQLPDMDSGDSWAFWYSGMEVLDDRVGFFATALPAGTSTVAYHMRAETPGISRALPTEFSDMYSPANVSYSPAQPMGVNK